jgi:hypothetical protein
VSDIEVITFRPDPGQYAWTFGGAARRCGSGRRPCSRCSPRTASPGRARMSLSVDRNPLNNGRWLGGACGSAGRCAAGCRCTRQRCPWCPRRVKPPGGVPIPSAAPCRAASHVPWLVSRWHNVNHARIRGNGIQLE